MSFLHYTFFYFCRLFLKKKFIMSVYCVQYYFIRLAKQTIFIVFKIYDCTPCICQVTLHLQYVVFELKKKQVCQPYLCLIRLGCIDEGEECLGQQPQTGAGTQLIHPSFLLLPFLTLCLFTLLPFLPLFHLLSLFLLLRSSGGGA